jgi:hypothetical protein
MKNSTPLEIVQSSRAASAVGFVGSLILAGIFIYLGGYLWTLIPLGLGFVWLDGMFRKKIITFYPVNRTIAVTELSLWRKLPKVRTIPWTDVADVLIEKWSGPRGGRHFEIYMLLRDKSRIILKITHWKKKAFALRRQIAHLVGVW